MTDALPTTPEELGIGDPLSGREQEVVIRNGRFVGRYTGSAASRRGVPPQHVVLFPEDETLVNGSEVPVMKVVGGIKVRVVGTLKPTGTTYNSYTFNPIEED